MAHIIKPLDDGDTGGRRVMRPPESLETIRAIQRPEPTPPTEPSETPPPSRRTDLDLSHYLILPGQTHGPYSYPDLLVATERTHIGLSWEEAQIALKEQGACMLTIRQYADLLKMLRSGKVLTGNRGQISFGIRPSFYEKPFVYGRAHEQRSPAFEGEWLDAHFVHFADGSPAMNYNHQWDPVLKIMVPETSPLEPCSRTTRRISRRISIDDWLDRANWQGMPPHDVGDGNLYYHAPKDDCVASFSLDEELAPQLICDNQINTNVPGWGVRAAYVK